MRSNQPDTGQSLDVHDVEKIVSQLEASRDELAGMVDVVGKAKQIKEWDSERRRAALSKHVAPLLATNGVSAAEHIARASAEYVNAMRLLQTDLYGAEKTLAQYEAIKCKWESARSILSMQRAIAGNI